MRSLLSRLTKIILPSGARFIPAAFVARRLRTTSTRPPRALPAVRLEPQLSKLILVSLLIPGTAIWSILAVMACSGLDEAAEIGPCFGSSDDAPVAEYAGCRVFKGRLQLPPAKELSLPARPLQLAAVGFEPLETAEEALPTDQVRRRYFFGAPISAEAGAGQRSALPFSITVPCGVSVNLLLQVMGAGGGARPGIQAAQLSFQGPPGGPDSTTLIPWQATEDCSGSAAQHDLGTVTLVLARRHDLTSGSIHLGAGSSASPLDLVPPSAASTTEGDSDGDGILDEAETLEALEDIFTPGAPPDLVDPQAPQPDGIPDLFQ